MICTRDLRHKVELEIQMASTSSKIKKSAPLSSTVVLPSLINKGCTHSFEINFINFDTYPKWISELWRHQIWLCPLFQ